MQTVRVFAGGDRGDAVRQAAEVLQAGGVVAAPTETVYGLMTLWGNARGCERIFRLKRRPKEKRLQMLAASIETAISHGMCDSPALRALAEAFWPGPLTVVGPASGGGTIGLRIPQHPFLLHLLRELGLPLAATSANLSGREPACTAGDAVRQLGGSPDLLVDGGDTREGGGEASTVVSVVGKPFCVLRSGPVTEEALCLALRPFGDCAGDALP